ncbi:MAG TPA: hypothetical protein VG815_16925 [Chloroflexota bacterium]|nr:hypothetical protein [Chloroflexota bacterium]
MNLRFGKKPADTAAFAAGLKFGAFVDSALPDPPLLIGRVGLIHDWGILGNDVCGDCAWSAAAHRVMQWHAIAGTEIPIFTAFDVESDYTSTGYVIGDDSTDQGTSMIDAVAYQKATGIRDSSGNRHKIEGSLFLRPGDVSELAKALYYFGALDIGVQLPSTAMDQFDSAEPWSVAISGGSSDGHCIPVIARNSAGNFICVTWGRIQAITPQFLMSFMDEGFAYYSEDMLRSDALSPRGIDKAGLLATLGKL